MTFLHRLRDAFAHVSFARLMGDFASLEKRIVTAVERLEASADAHYTAIVAHTNAADATEEKINQAHTLLGNIRKFVSEKL